jgi:hypothetical protein
LFMKMLKQNHGRIVHPNNILTPLLLVAMVAAAGQSWAAAPRFYADKSAFLADLRSAQVFTQDFSGFAVRTDMDGATLLPGVTVTSSFANLAIWEDHTLFGYDATTRALGKGCYEFHLAGYNAVGFDIVSWDPGSAGPARAIVHLGDGTTNVVERRQTGLTEEAPVFFGVIADQNGFPGYFSGIELNTRHLFGRYDT